MVILGGSAAIVTNYGSYNNTISNNKYLYHKDSHYAASQACIYIAESQGYNKILNNFLSFHCAFGIDLYGAGDNNIVQGNILNKTGDVRGYGIAGRNGGISNSIIKDNYVSGYYLGIWMGSINKNNSMINNTIESCKEGMVISASNSTIKDNKIKNNTEGGISVLVGYYGSPSNISLINNLVEGNGEEGIKLEGNKHILKNNRVCNNNQSGRCEVDQTCFGICVYACMENNLTHVCGDTPTQECKNTLLASCANSCNNTCFKCYSYPDILNNGTLNSGDNNTCDTTENWNDTGTTGCAYCCSDKGCPNGQVCNKDHSCITVDYVNENGICTIKAGQNCTAINKALNDTRCNTVKLTSDIINWTGTCINNPEGFNNKTFDCQGHTIGGNGEMGSVGIYLNEKSGNNTIKNCVVINFFDGIDLVSSSYNILINNTVRNNKNVGIGLDYSSNNFLINNTATNILPGIAISSIAGISLYNSSHNTLTNNIANNNEKGIMLDSSSHNTLTNNIANNNTYGIDLWLSSHNTLTNNIANNNSKYGIYLPFSDNNIINTNHLCSNKKYDIYGDTGNTGDNNTCDTIYNWNDNGTTGCTYDCSTCFCSSRDECNNKLNDNSCKTVKLTADIIGYSGACINNPQNFNNKVFDCQGHTIGGNVEMGSIGIYLDGKSGNTIKNCVIIHFFDGIALVSSSNNILINNTVRNNENIGIGLHYSSNNILINNTATNILPGIAISSISGIGLHDSSHNTLTNNIANNNTYGITLGSSSHNTLTNNIANNNTYGITLGSSSHNTLTNNIANNNSKYGIYLPFSDNNIINTNHLCSNKKYDIHGDTGNTGDNNTCDTTYDWNDDGTTGCTYSCDTCTCGSCDECEAKLNDPNCKVVVLTTDITDHSGTCINNPQNFNNKVFDCQGHTVDGDNSGWDYGIFLYGKSGNTIKNCVITDFGLGSVLVYSSNNNITKNTLNNNDDGVLLLHSSYNTITNNTANNNEWGGIILYYFSDSNTLIDNIANNNYLGIRLYYSSSNNIANNTANNNGDRGIELGHHSNYNTVTNNTANNNGDEGIFLWDSSNNILNANHFCSNSWKDIFNYGGTNTGDNNRCNKTYNWNDDGTTGCTYHC